MYQKPSENSMTKPIMRQLQFIVTAVTGCTLGIHRMTLKKAIHATAMKLIGTL